MLYQHNFLSAIPVLYLPSLTRPHYRCTFEVNKQSLSVAQLQEQSLSQSFDIIVVVAAHSQLTLCMATDGLQIVIKNLNDHLHSGWTYKRFSERGYKYTKRSLYLPWSWLHDIIKSKLLFLRSRQSDRKDSQGDEKWNECVISHVDDEYYLDLEAWLKSMHGARAF